MVKRKNIEETAKPAGRKSLKITRTPLHQLYGLMKRSNFYSNSLLSIISKHQVKSALKNLPPGKPGQKNIKGHKSKLGKRCGSKVLEAYSASISSDREGDVGSKLFLKVAMTVKCLVDAVCKENSFRKCYRSSIEKMSNDSNMADVTDDWLDEVKSNIEVQTRQDIACSNFSDCSNLILSKKYSSSKSKNIEHMKNIEDTPNRDVNNSYGPNRSAKCCRNIFQKERDLQFRNSIFGGEKPDDRTSYEFCRNSMPKSRTFFMQECIFVLESILSEVEKADTIGIHLSMNSEEVKNCDCCDTMISKEVNSEFDKELVDLDDASQHMHVDDSYHARKGNSGQYQPCTKYLNVCDKICDSDVADHKSGVDKCTDTVADMPASCNLNHQVIHEKVVCPVCSIDVSARKINEHLDICLGSSIRKRTLRRTKNSAGSETRADKISSSVAFVQDKHTELATEITAELELEAAADLCLSSKIRKLERNQKNENSSVRVQESDSKKITSSADDQSHMQHLNLSDNDMIEKAYEKLDKMKISNNDLAIRSEDDDDSLSSQEINRLSSTVGPVRRSSRTKNRKSYREQSDTEESEAEEEDESNSSQKKKVKTKAFSEGEIVEILYGTGDTEKKYKARILNCCRTNFDGWGYLVHYIGWSDYYDDWVLEDDIAIESFMENSNSQLKLVKPDPLLGFNSISDKEKLILAEKFYMPPHNEKSSIKELKREKHRRHSNKEKVNSVQPKLLTGGVLRDYQITGYEWLKTMLENGENGILADEMGLGKTIQCIAAVCHMIKIGMHGPFLVCAPMSTIQNWFLEFRRFAPQIPLLLYHGTSEERATLSLCMLQEEHKLKTRPVVITSFDVLMRDHVVLQAHTWSYLIVDEGHRIKNLKCKLLKELNHMQAKSKLLLTGTPLQNNLTELWSLLNFLLPEVFDDLKTFESWFDLNLLKKDERLLTVIHQILTPFILRRMKDDISLKLPPKREVIVHTPLSDKQERVYQALVNKSIDELMRQKQYYKSTVIGSTKISQPNEKSDQVPKLDNDNHKRITRSCAGPKKEKEDVKSTTVSTSNVIMQLRKCCNHPYLLDKRLDDYAFQADADLISSSGKMLILDQLLPPLKQRGHKVLLFSQMTRLLDILEEYCLLREFKYVRFDGQTSREERVEKVNKFNKNASVFIFLLSTRAGGLGINLTAADTVIIYDSDWNPQNDAQAQDRCHRIGQVRPVVIYRFVTPGTIDEQIIERATEKAELEKIIMHKARFKGNLAKELTDRTKVISGELLDLLKVFDIKRNCNDKKASTLLSGEDLERLLDRSYMKW